MAEVEVQFLREVGVEQSQKEVTEQMFGKEMFVEEQHFVLIPQLLIASLLFLLNYHISISPLHVIPLQLLPADKCAFKPLQAHSTSFL